MMLKYTMIILTSLSLSGCLVTKVLTGDLESVKPNNIIKTAATTAVTYTVAGPIPAILNLVTSVAVDEVLPPVDDTPKIDPGNKEQMWAYIWKQLMENILYGVIGFLTFTTIIAPWALQRRARRKRKYDQYKYEAKLARENNQK